MKIDILDIRTNGNITFLMYFCVGNEIKLFNINSLAKNIKNVAIIAIIITEYAGIPM